MHEVDCAKFALVVTDVGNENASLGGEKTVVAQVGGQEHLGSGVDRVLETIAS